MEAVCAHTHYHRRLGTNVVSSWPNLFMLALWEETIVPGVKSGRQREKLPPIPAADTKPGLSSCEARPSDPH